MRRLALLCALLFCAEPALAQFTVVSGTVTDVNGLPYSQASLTVTITLPTGAIGAYLNGSQIAGTVGPVKTDNTGSFLIRLADNAFIQCANAAGQLVACAPQTKWNFAVTLSPGVPPPTGTGPQTCSATLSITGSSQTVTSSFNACPALSVIVGGGGGLPAGGTVGQVIVNTGPGTGTWQDPNVSLAPVNLFNAVTANTGHTSANVKSPIYTQSGSLLLTFAGLTGVFTGCTLQIEAVDSLGNAVNSGAAISIIPSNGTQSIIVPVNASTTAPVYAAFIAAVYNCSAFGTGGTMSLDYAGQVGTPGHGTGATTVGTWVQPGQALIAQITEQNNANGPSGDLIVDVKILLPNGQIQDTRYEIAACNFNANVASSGFTVTQGGWIQQWTVDLNNAGHSWGSSLLNLYIANSIGAQNTTSCTGSLTTAQIGNTLGTYIMGSFLPTGFVGTTANITHPWSIPGVQNVSLATQPAVGNDAAIVVGGNGFNGRGCITGVNVFLTTSATVATRTLGLRVLQANGLTTVGVQPDLFWISPVDQTASTLFYYVFSPEAIPQQRTMQGNAGPIPFVTIPFFPGQICYDATRQITIGTRIFNLQANDQVSAMYVWTTTWHDND